MPNLTLEAPTLTLDPLAAVEEGKAGGKPVTLDSVLSPEEQKLVEEFSEKIDIENSTMVLQYQLLKENC